MTIQFHSKQNAIVVILPKHFDFKCCQAFSTVVQISKEFKPRKIVLDMANMVQMDTQAIELMRMTKNELKDSKIYFSLVSQPGHTRDMLKKLGFAEAIPTLKSVGDALSS